MKAPADILQGDATLRCPRQWALKSAYAEKYHATAVILAGGKSTRMGRDKRFLPFHGRPMVQHIWEQLAPFFEEVVISANDADRFTDFGVRVVADEIIGLGPLGGITAALEASRHECCFVLPCDMPHVNMTLLARLMAGAGRADCVVPVSKGKYYEPLFAVYRKNALPVIRRAILAGERRIMAAIAHCKIITLDTQDDGSFDNLNTIEDYRRCINS